MQVFIPSKGRARDIITPRILEDGGVPYRIVVDSEAEYDAYARNTTVPEERIVVSGTHSLVGARQWCLEHAAPGEWIMMMDDDVRFLYALEEPWYQQVEFTFDMSAETRAIWRPRFRHVLEMPEFLRYVRLDIGMAEALGANLIGYDQTENFLFRERQYRTVEYVSFDTFLVRRTGLNFDQELRSIDDYAFTAAHLERDGKVLVNHWIRPHASHYKDGGLGRREPERAHKRMYDVERIMAQYPGLYRLKKPRASDPFPWPDLAMKLHDEETIEAWRKGLNDARSTALAASQQLHQGILL